MMVSAKFEPCDWSAATSYLLLMVKIGLKPITDYKKRLKMIFIVRKNSWLNAISCLNKFKQQIQQLTQKI